MLRVLVFLRFYLPGYKAGGPLRTIANMVESLGHQFQFSIITSDRDVGDANPYENITADRWSQVGAARVYYASARQRTFRNLARLLHETPHEVLYLNSFFDPIFSMGPLLARRLGLAPTRPCLIAPRGEFSQGALALNSLKKRFYIAATGGVRLHRDLLWQASSELEADDIRRIMGRVANSVMVAADVPAAGCIRKVAPAPRAPNAAFRVCFLSRLSPKKNLDFALRVLAKASSNVRFSIFGPIEDEDYWRMCQKLIGVLPANIRAEYCGPVAPENVRAVFAGHDLFFFPTRGENFGHVILEALSTGTPVLISDQTPWAPDAAGACQICALSDIEGFARSIDCAAARSALDQDAVRNAACAYADRVVNDENILAANRALFLTAARGAVASDSNIDA